MTTLLLNLRQVPDDEADEVRALLDQHQIAYYETQPSLWGISSGGIWLTHPGDREQAKALLETYQQARARYQRDQFQQARRQGTAPTLADRFRQQPLRVLGLCLAITALLLLTLVPFLTFG